MKDGDQTESLLSYLHDTILILQAAIRHYHQGDKIFYRVAALQLRLLLCDSAHRHNRKEDISLLPILFPAFTLPPLLPDAAPMDGAHLLLSEWLAQPVIDLAGDRLTIREFIRRVCDQDGGAHVDPKPATGLISYPNRDKMIIGIAELVCSTLEA
jgi:hypothetical protein